MEINGVKLQQRKFRADGGQSGGKTESLEKGCQTKWNETDMKDGERGL